MYEAKTWHPGDDFLDKYVPGLLHDSAAADIDQQVRDAIEDYVNNESVIWLAVEEGVIFIEMFVDHRQDPSCPELTKRASLTEMVVSAINDQNICEDSKKETINFIAELRTCAEMLENEMKRI